MTKQEIEVFIETMEEIGDKWTVKEVEDSYFSKMSLEDAIKERKAEVDTYLDSVSTVVKYIYDK